jgi:predicted oxidoreductase
MKAGKVRSVGVSNYSTHQSALLAKYLGQPPVTNQVEINLQRMDAIYDGTLDQCQLMTVTQWLGVRLLAAR